LALCLSRSSEEIEEHKNLLSKATKIKPEYLDAKHNLTLLSTPLFDARELILTAKPLRRELTHIDNYK
ncbi:MAG: hypothetical protein VW622_14355, partial [Opitutae bacterium]